MRLNEIEVPQHYKYLAADQRLNLSQELVDSFRFVEQIKRDCQPFLQQVNNQPFNKFALYRGIHNTEEPFVTKEVRLKNRKPSDTSLTMHQIIQGYFKKTYGEAYRSAMFTTGDRSTADEYGTLYKIFPIGDFTFLWSKEIEDLYSILDEYDLGGAVEFHKDEDPAGFKEVVNNFKNEVLTTYQTSELHTAILSRHEIMIRVPKYYAMREDYITYAHMKAYTELLK